MRITSRRGTIVFFVCLGIGLVALAVALNVGWIILNWREGVLLLFGIIFFALIIAGMIVNTSFLVREIRRSEQHDSFINAVTHELKTPVASIRLHLETLQRRDLPEPQKQEFYRLMLSDTDRLTETVEQVLRAGRAGDKKAGREKSAVDFRQIVREAMDAARTRHHLPLETIRYEEASNQASTNGTAMRVLGSDEDLRTAVFNVLDNAIKYSGDEVDIRTPRAGSRHRHSRRRHEEHLQALLPRQRPLAGTRKRNWARAFHCEVSRRKARWQGVCRKCRRRAGNYDYLRTAEVFIVRASVMSARVMRSAA
jgi:signal transduction histidine kinase